MAYVNEIHSSMLSIFVVLVYKHLHLKIIFFQKILTLRSQAGARLIRTPRKNMFVTMTAKIVESVIIIMLRQK